MNKILIIFLLSSWGGIYILINKTSNFVIDESLRLDKQGQIVEVKCLNTRNSAFAELGVKYDNENEISYDSLSLRDYCNEEFVNAVMNKRVLVSKIKNQIFGVVIDNHVLIDYDEQLSSRKNNKSSEYFLILIGVVLTFVIFSKLRISYKLKKSKESPIKPSPSTGRTKK